MPPPLLVSSSKPVSSRVSVFRRQVAVLCFTACAVLFSASAAAVPAMGMGYEPKYPADYKHFDYVNPGAPRKGELVLMGLGAFDSLNPYLLKGISASGMGTLVFESLLEKSLDEPFSEYGLIADDFSLAEDELSATFHINPKARFSNGDPITAHDVKYSFDTLMSKAALITSWLSH